MRNIIGLHTKFLNVKMNLSDLSNSNASYINFSDSEINDTVMQKNNFDNASFFGVDAHKLKVQFSSLKNANIWCRNKKIGFYR